MTASHGNHPDRPSARRGGGATQRTGNESPVHPATSNRARSTIALLLAGPVIWSGHFMVVYLAVEAGCTGDGPGLDAFDPPAPTVVTVVATLVGAAASLLAALLSRRRWHTDRAAGRGETALRPSQGLATLAAMGYLLGLLGVVTILFVGAAVLFLPACLP
jgi:hypothetical protein